MGLYQQLLESSDQGAFINLRDGSGVNLTSTLISGHQALDVNVVSASSGTADETAFTYGSSTYQAVGGVYQDTSPTLTAGQGGAARLTQYRGLHINLRTSGGVELLGQQTMAASVPVVIASNQAAFPVTLTSLGSPSGGTAGTTSDLAGLIYNSTALTLTNGQQASLQGDVNGYLITNDVNSKSLNAKASPSTGTPTTVAVSTTNTSVLSANAARKGVILTNATSKVVYIAVGFSASGTAYSFPLQQNGTYEGNLGTFVGAINAIWPATATGTGLLVTELT